MKFAKKLKTIEDDMNDTLSIIEKVKAEGDKGESWTDEYMLEVMRNQEWLIEQAKKIKQLQVLVLSRTHVDTLNREEAIYIKDLQSILKD